MADTRRIPQAALLATAGLGLMVIVLRQRARIFQWYCNLRNPLRHRCIQVIESPEECASVVGVLKQHCDSYKVLGFDCEWVTVNGQRRPTALLQLSSHKGLCALFRLNCMKHIPKTLRELLEDDEILKVGVGPQDDSKKLSYDYGVGVASTFDLRFLSVLIGQKPEGLGKLTNTVLNVQLDKNWRIAVSNWEAVVLSEKQQVYAANDALVAVEIFKKLSDDLEPRGFFQSRQLQLERVNDRLNSFYDVRFVGSFLTATNLNSSEKLLSVKRKKEQWKRSISTRAKALYDNCLLEAPDGELLCTIDRRKAKWYLEHNLGVEIKSEPFTVRLNFEPAGRAVGEVGRYYQTPKENQCVVCGNRDAYIRKNVVPREYRKHFPEVLKTHTSHDVLLLCPNCHQLSNISDLKIRLRLAAMCGAPFTAEDSAFKFKEVPELKKLKSAARALLYNGHQIPVARCEELKNILLQHYKEERAVTDELLEEAANLETTIDNEKYCQHGLRVVQMYQTEFGGLVELERMWREHFLHTMKPKFLPALWNINHNADRLEIRAQEGRIDKEDLIAVGLEPMP